ncbi:PREDICTED: E3 ubiquitin-protein ligase MIB2-like, partial [Priapulus caudatus]|uniref:E3 ubiquitin-protein ligase MIB2-like n=1 Tax=Priapulus caudatus TaxID=37621 RepID=A0ABM1F677_PRICU
MSELEVRGLCQNIGLAMACYLAQKGSNLAHRNKERKCPLDYVNVQLAEVIKYYASLSLLESAPCPSSATMATDTLPPEEILLCMICDEPRHLVTFKPCEHRVACDECCIRMKRCMTCQSPIATKLDT